jgi:bla regulator protein blaR1
VAELRRLEIALGALGFTAALLVFVTALDAVHYHGLAVGPQLAVAALDAVVVLRAAASLARQLRAHRRFLRGLPVLREALVHGHRVRVVPGRAFQAFCAGLLHPAVYVSEGTLRAAGDAELRAVLAHEEHHRARRDPLRLLLARTVSDALRPLPLFASLARREAALADLAADAATVDRLGDRMPLASALARFDEVAGVAPERVDRLVAAAPPPTVPSALLAAAGVVLAGVAALAAPMLLGGWHPDLTLPVSYEPLALIAAGAPACLAAHRAGICLRPSG